MLNAFIELFVHLFAWIGVNLSIKADEVKNKKILNDISRREADIKKSEEDYYKRCEEDIRREFGD